MVNLINNYGKKWCSFSDGWVKGFAYKDNILLENESLFDILLKAISTSSLSSLLSCLNGNFTAIVRYDNKYYLIVDKIRSYPLLYSLDNGLYITDVGDTIIDNNRCDLDEVSKYKLLSLGYLSGSSTLIKGVKSVVAGCYAVIDIANCLASQYNYFSHVYEKINRSKEVIFHLSSIKIEEAFSRILASLKKESQILIPLSGGYDSRLIACLCKKFGLKNVICFTYGRNDSFEVAISKQVACQLNYEWCFVEYSEKTWSEFLSGDSFYEYCKFAGNITANPHFQDLPALLELRRRGIINSDMIVIPGHSGDLLGGSKIPVQVLENSIKSFSLEGVSDLIYKNFFDLNTLRSEFRKEIIIQLKDEIKEFDIQTVDDFLDYYEGCWFIKSKIANFLVNSMRGYEFLGLDWRLPLWDDEYVKVWYETKWKSKYYSKLYNEFMFDNYFIPCGVDIRKQTNFMNSNLGIVIKKLTPSFVSAYYRNILSRSQKGEIKKHFDAFDSVVRCLLESSDIVKYNGIDCINLSNVNAIVAAYYLKILS